MPHAFPNNYKAQVSRPRRQRNPFVPPKALVLFVALALNWPAMAADLSKVVIIKADDFTATNQAWSNFLDASRAAGVKVSIGVITSIGPQMTFPSPNFKVPAWRTSANI